MNFKNIRYENKLFYTFLAIHLMVWTLIGLIRQVMPTDALEGIYWGSLQDFGTPKHPPLFGWIAYLIFYIFETDFSIYLISQFFILLGFIYIYRLAKFFMDDNRAMLSVVLMEGCWTYSYITCYYGFNPDVILLFTLPAIAYYLYKCVYTDNKIDWIKLGIVVGLSFLNKYQTGMLIIPMAIWALLFKRDVYRNKYFYLSVFIAFVIFLPHILWLIKYDFFPFLYFDGELKSTGLINHITAPLYFILMQFAVTVGSLFMFAVMKLWYKSPFKLTVNNKKNDYYFILLLGLLPFILHALLGFIEGGTVRPRWGFEFWFMLGIMLFYFFPIEIKEKEFKFMINFAYIAMLITAIAMGTLLSVEKNYRSRYPVKNVLNDLNIIWKQNNNTEIKYFGGYIEWTLPLCIYNNTKPICILDTFQYPNPWIDRKHQQKSGTLIIDRTKKNVISQTRRSCPFLPHDYKIEPISYSLTVKNAFNMPREYNIYYFIVPPMK